MLENYLLQNTDLYKLGILLALYTGIRVGELCALCWDDIDDVNKTLHRIRIGNKTVVEVTPPKTNASIRKIPLPSRISLIVEEHRTSGRIVKSMHGNGVEPRLMQIKFKKILSECDKDAVTEYTSYLPQKLSEIQTIENNNDYWIKLGTVTDIFNVERDEVCSGGSYGGTVIFYTSGRYVKLSGQLVATKSRGGNADSDISIKIYADDKLLYESGDIAYTEENFTINLDITGVRQLKLVIDAGTIFDATVS